MRRIAVFVMTGVLLAGCGGGSSPEERPTTTQEEAPDPAIAAMREVREAMDLMEHPLAVYIPADGSSGRSVGSFLVITAQLDRDDPDAEALCGNVVAVVSGDPTAPWDTVQIESGSRGGIAAQCYVR